MDDRPEEPLKGEEGELLRYFFFFHRLISLSGFVVLDCWAESRYFAWYLSLPLHTPLPSPRAGGVTLGASSSTCWHANLRTKLLSQAFAPVYFFFYVSPGTLFAGIT